MTNLTQFSARSNDPARQVLQHAKTYAKAGVRVLPLKANSKAACLHDWVNKSFSDPEQVLQWFGNGAVYNIGLAMGSWQHTDTDGTYLVCVDIDMHGQINGKAAFDQLAAEHGGDIGEPFIADTATDGLHLVYTTTEPLTNERGALPPGVDIRGQGGYIMTEPSRHPDNGKTPKWRANANWPGAKPGLMPQWLVDVIKTKPEPVAPITTLEPRVRAVGDDTRPGNIYNSTHTWPQVLAAYGWQQVETNSNKSFWSRPGKPATKDAHSAVLTHDAGANGVFTVFSTNAPHELMRADHTTNTGGHYKFTSPFDFYACMQHEGDHTKAAQAYGAELRTRQQPDIDRLMRPTNVATNEPGKPPLTVVKSEPTPDETETPSGQSYKLQNMADLVGVPYEPRLPDRLLMTNNRGLYYSNADNLTAGASGVMKTWLSALTCLQQIKNGKHVVIIDYEMQMREWFERFTALGATDTELKLVHYCAPDEALRAVAYGAEITTAAEQTMHKEIERVSSLPGGLAWVVIDGITQGMTQNNLKLLDNTDIAKFWQLLPRQIVRATGAGVGANDHLPKAPGDNPTPIGGQHKVATTSGAAHILTATSYLSKAPNKHNKGVVLFHCIKDRYGEIGQHRKVAQAIFTPLGNGMLHAIVEPYTGEHDQADQVETRKHADILQTIAECNANQVVASLNKLAQLHTGGNKVVMNNYLTELARQGKAHNRGGTGKGNAHNWFITKSDTPDADLTNLF